MADEQGSSAPAPLSRRAARRERDATSPVEQGATTPAPAAQEEAPASAPPTTRRAASGRPVPATVPDPVPATRRALSPARPRSRRRLVLAAAGGVVVLAILVGALVAYALRPGDAPPDPTTAPVDAGSPSAVVTGYLEALAAGDAETALAYAGQEPADASLLTDAMLAASLEAAPITDVRVTETTADGPAVDVPASFRLGDETVSGTWAVQDQDGDGRWELTAALGEFMIPGSLAGLALTLNGEDIGDATTVTLFPGAYEIATTTPGFTLDGTTLLLVRSPFDEPAWGEVSVGLTDDGLAAFRSAVQDAVAECLASTQPEAGCGLSLPETFADGTTLVPGTIVRTLTPEAQAALDALEPTASEADPLLVRGGPIGAVAVTAGLEGGGTGDIVSGPGLGAPLVDFTSGEPVVRWDG